MSQIRNIILNMISSNVVGIAKIENRITYVGSNKKNKNIPISKCLQVMNVKNIENIIRNIVMW